MVQFRKGLGLAEGTREPWNGLKQGNDPFGWGRSRIAGEATGSFRVIGGVVAAEGSSGPLLALVWDRSA